MNRILVVRRDNIGDLVCTTPLLAALRTKFPQAWIGALVNSYNAPVLERNPRLDAVFAYIKLKHLGGEQGFFTALGRRLRDTLELRRRKLDCVILATPGFSVRTLRLARLLAPAQVAGFSDGSIAASSLDLPVPLSQVEGKHEVERVFALASVFGIESEIPALELAAEPMETARFRKALPSGEGPVVAIHISARRPAQRWPAERFAQLAQYLHAAHGARIVLLWSPGGQGHSQHPGDDEKAAQIAQALGGNPFFLAYRTTHLQQLIAALGACDLVVCSDGGALHLAAALRRPIVCFFGDSPVERWAPWGVPHRVLRPASRNVADLSVDEAAGATASLLLGASVLRNPGA
jgi:heptosyltransferase-3